MIRFENVTKMLGGRTVLDNLSFEVQPGEMFVIVGPSGVGKSVTLKHMVRLLTPDTGDVYIAGESVVNADVAGLERIRERFGYLFQGGALLAWMTVAENVAFPLVEKTRETGDTITARVNEVLEMVGLENDGGKYPSEISGGMRKRAGLARAIVRKPEIVLYDEPTSGLDPVTSRTIDDLMTRLRKTLGMTSVVVTHDLHSALSIGSRIAMLNTHGIMEPVTPEQFIKSDHADVQAFLEAQYITKAGPWERKQA